jgi:Site-specific recombinase XerD
MLGNKPSRTWLEAEKKWLEEKKTKRSICDDIFIFEWLQNHLGHLHLKDITRELIESIAKKKEETGVAPATVNRMLALLKSVLNRAHKHWEWIDKVPHAEMRKEDNKRIRWITYAEAQRLLAELPAHARDKAKFSLATGLRAFNVSFLEWHEVDLVQKRITIDGSKMKSGKRFSMPLNQDAIDVIRAQIGKHHQYVFVYDGHPTKKCSTRSWKHALKRAGITNFKWHDLRHTFFSWLAQNGATLQEIMELGGWSKVDMALRYSHLNPSHLQDTVDKVTGAKLGTLKLVTTQKTG